MANKMNPVSAAKRREMQKQKQKKILKTVLIVLAVLAVITGALAAAGVFSRPEPDKTDKADITPSLYPAVDGKYYVSIETEGFGTIVAELYPEIAPITVSNFLKLANSGFYDGLTFHRIISGFMIQGGDPKGNGTGGSDQNIKGEFSANGVKNTLSHTRGVLSMARSSNYNSASSQFFIMHKDSKGLDGQYAAFGKVLSGMEVVDAICAKTPVIDNNGTVKAGYQPRIITIRQIEKPE